MIKRIEYILEIFLLCLAGWLVYDLMSEAAYSREIQMQEELEEQIIREETEKLPPRYDARENARSPMVKNQGTLGTCWAVTASSALESYFLPEESDVFSADHVSLQNSFAKEQNDGGDYTMVMAYLAGWQGPVFESDDPYGDGQSPQGLAPVKHVQEMQMIKDKDYDAIKRAITKYGAVQSSIYMDLRNAFSSSIYYNQLEYSYYYDGPERSNHDILIIGWNDYYDASKFNRSTSKNGAFICQNSWGEQFGDAGIFYVSYEDINIGRNCIVYTDIQETDNYDHIYQTDLCGWVGQLGYGDGNCFFANVYEAQGIENLEAVGFYATGRNTDYTIYVVEDFKDDSSFLPRKPLQSGKIREIGYYTIPLKQTFSLEPGQRYAILIEISTPDTRYPVATEYAADEATKTVDISDGEGYISHNGVMWTRTEEEHEANVCLKAYTTNR